MRGCHEAVLCTWEVLLVGEHEDGHPAAEAPGDPLQLQPGLGQPLLVPAVHHEHQEVRLPAVVRPQRPGQVRCCLFGVAVLIRSNPEIFTVSFRGRQRPTNENIFRFRKSENLKLIISAFATEVN